MPRKNKIMREPIVQKISRKKYTLPVKLLEEKPIPVRFKKVNILPQTNKELKARVREPDPIITILQNIIDESSGDIIDLACRATISYTTLKRIIEGKTSRPQHSTVKSILTACGYEYLIEKRKMAEVA